MRLVGDQNCVVRHPGWGSPIGCIGRERFGGMRSGGAFYGAEAFVLPSHQENFGIAVADALACGTIALISDKVNIAEDVSTDGAAFVEPDTMEGTEALLERFLALSEEDRRVM